MPDIAPSWAHVCDLARVRRRAARRSFEETRFMCDRELAKTPADMARATQYAAECLIHKETETLMLKLESEYCGVART